MKWVSIKGIRDIVHEKEYDLICKMLSQSEMDEAEMIEILTKTGMSDMDARFTIGQFLMSYGEYIK